MDYIKVVHRCPACNKTNYPIVRNDSVIFTCQICNKAEMEQVDFPASIPLESTTGMFRIVLSCVLGVVLCGALGLRGWIPYTLAPLAIGFLVFWMFPIRQPKLAGIERIKLSRPT